jgi:DNA topoisomerase-1
MKSNEAAFAEETGLRYVHVDEPGFTRRRRGKNNFAYFDANGRALKAPAHLKRIKSLVIPPAWEGVWICRHADGHIQCTGRDVRGRKQYRYHPLWTAARNETKFRSLRALSRMLPPLRRRVNRDLALPGLPREKVLAAVVRLLELTQIRVGNDEYAATNDSYGLTTILNRHARVNGTAVAFRFKGKSGVLHDVHFKDPRLSRIISSCQHLPGQRLFEYVDEKGTIHKVGSADVNAYLKDSTGGDVTAKDLRTWSGSAKALDVLRRMGPSNSDSERARKARELMVVKETASHLRNTVAVCRKYYVHPAVFEADRRGRVKKAFSHARTGRGLSHTERALASLLR